MVAPDHRHHFARAIARCIHQILASGVALVCSYPPLATRHSLDPDDAGEALDLRAEVARALGEGLRELAGIDVAVERIVQAADYVFERDERVSLFDLVGRDDRKIDALRARHRADVGVFVHAVARVREADRAGDVIIDGIADPRAEFGVEPRGAALEFDDVPTRRKIRAIAGGVPCRAGSEFVALDQQRIAPTAPGEMVERARPHRAAADDDHPCMRLHRVSRRLGAKPQSRLTGFAGAGKKH